jgi:hypothetical protein
MTSEKAEKLNSTEPAVKWVMRHEDGQSPRNLEFVLWLEESGNRALYEEAAAMSKLLESLDPERKIDVEALIAQSSTELDVVEEARTTVEEFWMAAREATGRLWVRVVEVAVAVAAAVISGVRSWRGCTDRRRPRRIRNSLLAKTDRKAKLRQ